MWKSIAFLGVIVLVLSCGNNSSTNETTSKSVFRYNQSSGISSLDPAFARDQANMWATNQIFNGLVQFNEALEIVPCIASSWTVSEDGRVYTFAIRDDVFFHDHELFPNGKGRQVNAEDVAYSLNRIIDPGVASTGGWLFNGKVIDEEPFQAISEDTLEIHLQEPFRPLLGVLTLQYCSVVPKEIAEHYGKEFRNHPIGTGPFHFKTWKENELLLLEKNENYFEKEADLGLPKLDAVAVSFIANKATEWLEFVNGNLDFVSGIDKSFKDEVLTPNGELNDKYKTDLRLTKAPYLNTEYLGILNKGAPNPQQPLTIKAVRQAIQHAIDKDKMIAFLRNNVGSPAYAGAVPKGVPSHDPNAVKGYNYDLDKARQILVQAGYAGGQGLGVIKLQTNETYIDLCTNIQQSLGDIGLTVELEVLPSAHLRELMRKGEVDFFRASWIADYPDGESFLAMFYGNNPAPPNYTRFSNTEFDELYEQSLNEQDDAKRYALYHQMDQLVLDEALFIPLFYDEVMRFTKPNIKGLGSNAMNMLDLKKVRIEK